MANRRELLALLLAGGAALALSGIAPYDRATWLMEVAPIFLGVPLLLATASRFPLTPLLYRLLFVHALILMMGGHYTYARVPLGSWIQHLLGLARNDYDRLGHFAQGFVPALIAREVLLRTSPLKPGRWLFFLVTCVALAISACYEFIEWGAALLGGAARIEQGLAAGHLPDRGAQRAAAASPAPGPGAGATGGTWLIRFFPESRATLCAIFCRGI